RSPGDTQEQGKCDPDDSGSKCGNETIRRSRHERCQCEPESERPDQLKHLCESREVAIKAGSPETAASMPSPRPQPGRIVFPSKQISPVEADAVNPVEPVHLKLDRVFVPELSQGLGRRVHPLAVSPNNDIALPDAEWNEGAIW